MDSKRETARERERTDDSLRVERQKTDEELGERGRTREGDADEVIRRARDRADR